MKSFLWRLRAIFSTSILAVPYVALAQFTQGNPGGLGSFGNDVINFIKGVLVPFVFAVALLLFIFGMYLYFIAGGGDDEKRETGRKYLLWSVIALVIMVSVWGIVNLIAGGLGFDNQETITDYIPSAEQRN